MNTVTLAFLGDAFFELTVRRRIAERCGAQAADRLHLMAVRYVKASSQAAALRGLAASGILSDEEQDIVRKARNRKPKSIPKNADPLEYKHATAFEALLGYHYIEGRLNRAESLAEMAMMILDKTGGNEY